MKLSKDRLEWLEFDLLKHFPEIVHGTFTRHGGASQKPYASLNLCKSVGDHPDHVKANRELVIEALELNQLVFLEQNHGSNIVEITAANVSKTHQADGFFTKESKIGLAIFHADCQAALFFDPVTGTIGAAHAGWKGSAQNIYQKLIQQMVQSGVKAEDLKVCISPSLGPDHAEMINYKKELPEELWSYQVQPNYFDFWAISKAQLRAEGILEENIECAEICSYCSDRDYFSHRRDKKTGRNCSIIGKL